jgi:tRNA G37 N-methylase Trm5
MQMPGGQSKCTVHANDLNPASFHSLVENIATNKLTSSQIQPYNLDAREFILDLQKRKVSFDEVIMNLPASATDFLDVFIGLLHNSRAGQGPGMSQGLPRIHVYGFSNEEDPVADMAARASKVLRLTPDACLKASKESKRLFPADLKAKKASVEGGRGGNRQRLQGSGAASLVAAPTELAVPCVGHVVRDVSPRKMMVCLSFRLPEESAYAEPLYHLDYKYDNKTPRRTEEESNREKRQRTL